MRAGISSGRAGAAQVSAGVSGGGHYHDLGARREIAVPAPPCHPTMPSLGGAAAAATPASSSVVAGLMFQGKPVPLCGVSADIKIVDFTAHVTLSQRYCNLEEQPIEVTYVFPVDDKAAVTGFTACVRGRVMKGVIKEKEAARAEYKEAVSQGQGAYLLEATRPDTFQMTVGNLPARSQALIQIEYVTELVPLGLGSAIDFVLPTCMAPRYHPIAPADRDRLSGPINAPFADEVPYGLRIQALVCSAWKIQSIASPTHAITTRARGRMATATLTNGVACLDGNFELTVKLEDRVGPRVVAEYPEAGSTVAVMLSFCPTIDVGALDAEVAFVLDRSGSMRGERMADARAAVSEGLKRLPESCHFNVISFGSDHASLFPAPVLAEQGVVKKAMQRVAKMDADMGGTELLTPLRSICQRPLAEGRPRNVFLFTDGSVSNTHAVTTLVRASSHTTRVFSFGIGQGVSRGLVNGIARAGNGKAVFVDRDSHDSLSSLCAGQVRRALQPAMTEVALSFEGTPGSVTTAPSVLPPIFSGDYYAVYAILARDDVRAGVSATLSARGPDGVVEFKLKLPTRPSCSGTALHSLAAKRLVSELQEGAVGQFKSEQQRKAEIIRLGCAYSIATEHTSFIAVEQRKQAAVQQTAASRSVPSLPPRAHTQSRGGAAMTRSRLAKHKRKATAGSGMDVREDQPPPLNSKGPRPTPFGLPAYPVAAGFADREIALGLRGPRNVPFQRNCWLNAALAFVLTLADVQAQALAHATSPLQDPLAAAVAELFAVWRSSQSAVRPWRRRLEQAYAGVTNAFAALGFPPGEDHCVVSAVETLLACFEAGLQAPCRWEVLAKNVVTGVKRARVQRRHRSGAGSNADLLVVVDRGCDALETPLGFRLCGFVSMDEQPLGSSEFVGHFCTFATAPDGYFLLDGVLDLGPGAYQGGFVPSTSPVHDHVLADAAERVPVALFIREGRA